MPEVMNLFASLLVAYSVAALIIGFCGYANDHTNNYPGPLLLSGLVAIGLAELLLRFA